jgi:hypothetical protein
MLPALKAWRKIYRWKMEEAATASEKIETDFSEMPQPIGNALPPPRGWPVCCGLHQPDD